jgi:hypothetical protein
MTVDKTMIELQSRYDFIWGSVGSDNPESDYDLTVRTHCRASTDKMKWDYQVVQEANRILSADFGVPPVVLFDTNLYAEAAVAPNVLSPEEEADPAIAGPVKAMSAMKEQGQDVGALMKLRRFMDWEHYEGYKAGMLEKISDRADRAAVLRQFEEADALYRGDQGGSPYPRGAEATAGPGRGAGT